MVPFCIFTESNIRDLGISNFRKPYMPHLSMILSPFSITSSPKSRNFTSSGKYRSKYSEFWTWVTFRWRWSSGLFSSRLKILFYKSCPSMKVPRRVFIVAARYHPMIICKHDRLAVSRNFKICLKQFDNFFLSFRPTSVWINLESLGKVARSCSNCCSFFDLQDLSIRMICVRCIVLSTP